MLTRQPERPTQIIGHKYFYLLGLLSGIGLTFAGLALLADFKSDSLDAHLLMGLVGLLLAMMGLLPLTAFYMLKRRFLAEHREGLNQASLLGLNLISLSLSSLGMSLFSLKMLQLLLGPFSYVPDIINGLFLVGGFILLMMGVKRLAAAYERMKLPQVASDQNVPADE